MQTHGENKPAELSWTLFFSYTYPNDCRERDVVRIKHIQTYSIFPISLLNWNLYFNRPLVVDCSIGTYVSPICRILPVCGWKLDIMTQFSLVWAQMKVQDSDTVPDYAWVVVDLFKMHIIDCLLNQKAFKAYRYLFSKMPQNVCGSLHSANHMPQ